MRYKQPFSLVRRPAKTVPFIYYYHTYDESGHRLPARSTGTTNRRQAYNYAMQHYKDYLLVMPGDARFGEFAAPYWKYDECPYVAHQRRRGKILSRSYADRQRKNLEHHVIPAFGKHRLSEITGSAIEDWMYDLRDKGFAEVSVNHIFDAFRTVLADAVRTGKLQVNPADKVEPLVEHAKPREILSPDEVRAIFGVVWPDPRHKALNMLAAATGMRVGEIQGLKIKCVHEEYVEVLHSWDRSYGLKDTKTAKPRVIPIPKGVSKCLKEHIVRLPSKDPEALVFHHLNPEKPFDHKAIQRELYRAFESIGISEEQRRKRNLTFHSWRHFFNSYFRGRVHDSKLQQLTGHSTLQMTDHYTHYRKEDYSDVREIQEEMF